LEEVDLFIDSLHVFSAPDQFLLSHGRLPF
jgi:hypothetical protein